MGDMICADCDRPFPAGCYCLDGPNHGKPVMRLLQEEDMTPEDYIAAALHLMEAANHHYGYWEASENGDVKLPEYLRSGLSYIQGYMLGVYMFHMLAASELVEKAGMRLRMRRDLLTDGAHHYWGETGHNMLGHLTMKDGIRVECFHSWDSKTRSISSTVELAEDGGGN